MLEVLKIIDGVLKLAIVRWGMLVTIIVMTAAITIFQIQLSVTNLQLKAQKGENATLTAKIDVQNESIIKAGADMAEKQKQAAAAAEKVTELKKQLTKRKTEIREIVLQGDCPQMVQQALDEVRK